MAAWPLSQQIGWNMEIGVCTCSVHLRLVTAHARCGCRLVAGPPAELQRKVQHISQRPGCMHISFFTACTANSV